MGGFDKIDFNTKEDQTERTTLSDTSMTRRKKTLNILTIAGIIAGVFILFIIFLVIIPAVRIYSQAKKTAAQAKIVATALKQENIEEASTQIAATKVELAKTQQDLAGVSYMQFIPLVNFYYGDAYHLMQAGIYAINAGQIAIDAVKPYADLLGLKGAHSFSGGSAQDRIKTAVLTLEKITPKIDAVESQFIAARNEIDAVDPNHYPSLFGGQKIKDQLVQVKTFTDEGASFIQQAKPLIKVLPSLLGEPTDQKYLVLFQNDAERRPTGGFLTAYAIFRMSQGAINVDTSNDIYTLDATIPNKTSAPRPLLQYLPNVPEFNLRDTNLSPDFYESMKTFESMYEKSSAYQKVNGIIAIDTHVLVSAMNILGDVSAGGTTFTTKQNTFCHCPDVIYQLESSADRPVNYVRTDRKSIIGELMYAIMSKALASSPRQTWGPLMQVMIDETNQKHLLFDVFNPDAQNGLVALNAAGRIQDAKGDYLHINDANFGGAKANMYVSESVDQKYTLNGDNSITKTVTINYKNPYPPSDCNLERGGLCLNAPLRNWLRVYVPQGSQLIDSQGSQVKVITYDELGKTVFEGFFIVNPLGSKTFTISYKLPFKLADNSSLPLLMQKQPGVISEDSTISVGNTNLNSFSWTTDKTLNLNLR